jgi:hypothetical protein
MTSQLVLSLCPFALSRLAWLGRSLACWLTSENHLCRIPKFIDLQRWDCFQNRKNTCFITPANVECCRKCNFLC